jgi:hypothetical protein
MPKAYQGHHCWNCWNVSLWISNDEFLYRLALDCKRVRSNVRDAARMFIRCTNGKTRDGATFTLTAVTRALQGLE